MTHVVVFVEAFYAVLRLVVEGVLLPSSLADVVAQDSWLGHLIDPDLVFLSLPLVWVVLSWRDSFSGRLKLVDLLILLPIDAHEKVRLFGCRLI